MKARADWTRHLTGLPGRGNKYRAQPVTVDGIRFDSGKEATRYQELRARALAGEISGLELQPRFPLHVVDLSRTVAPLVVVHYCGSFTADFKYVDNATGLTIIEDTKSGPTKTEAYRLRKKLVEAIHGITIREI